jgi:AraC-like DNA-binding protein
MLWYIRGGVATLNIDGQESPFVAGDLVCVPPGVVHSATHDPARPLWTITTHFTFRDATGAAQTLPPDVLPRTRCATREPHVFDAYFERLLALAALQPPVWRAVAGGLILVMLVELYREHAQAVIGPATGRSAYPAIAQALLRLEAEGHFFATSSSLASACGLSRGYFNRLFRRQFGRTPQEYLVTRRIERARYLLLESDLSVQQVARSLGYRDVYFFTRQFKAHVGQPPLAFRRAARP